MTALTLWVLVILGATPSGNRPFWVFPTLADCAIGARDTAAHAPPSQESGAPLHLECFPASWAGRARHPVEPRIADTHVVKAYVVMDAMKGRNEPISVASSYENCVGVATFIRSKVAEKWPTFPVVMRCMQAFATSHGGLGP